MPPSTERVRQDVADISNPNQLISYATSAQLEQVTRQRDDVSLRKIAQAASLGGTPDAAAAALTKSLRAGPSPGQLQQLDEIIGALVPELEDTGGLCSLALRLTTTRHDTIRGSLTAHVPPSWTRKIFNNASPDDLGVLIQASALLSAFQAADKMQVDRSAGAKNVAARTVAAIRDRYRAEIPLLVRRLILISVGPPTPRNIDAQVMLGSLATYAFDMMRPILEKELRYSPLGFRVWRAITKLVKLSPHEGALAEELQSWVRPLIEASEDLRKRSLYAGRSLDLELAAIIPRAWSPANDDWVARALLTRARNKEATIRERGTAAMGLAARAFSHEEPDKALESNLRDLIDEFQDPDDRPDARAGLEWVAATLQQAIEEREPVCNNWPHVDAPWFEHVQEATAALDNMGIPVHLLVGTKCLFQHMLLQNSGVYRRQAVETLCTSGWSDPIARALGILLQKEQHESWIRIRALFALGFLQRRNELIEEELVAACQQARANLDLTQIQNGNKPPRRAHVTEMHTVLFAVGDCFGTPGAEESARRIRNRLRGILTDLASLEGDTALAMRRATRAAAYLLTVCAQPRQDGKPDLSEELLERLRHHPDPETVKLSEWALSFLWADDGTVRPLLSAVEHGSRD